MATQITQQTTLAEITADLVEDLLRSDSDEDIYFDFKEGLDSKDPKSVHAIRKAIASFANTLGGFLFLGVIDKGNTNKQGLGRLVGVANATELGKRITQRYLGRDLCIPAVHIEGPQILSVTGYDVAVVRIPRVQVPMCG